MFLCSQHYSQPAKKSVSLGEESATYSPFLIHVLQMTVTGQGARVREGSGS